MLEGILTRKLVIVLKGFVKTIYKDLQDSHEKMNDHIQKQRQAIVQRLSEQPSP